MIEIVDRGGYVFTIDLVGGLLCCLALSVVVSLIKFINLRILSRRFIDGKTDEKFIKKCYNNIKFYKFKRSAQLYDTLSVMISSAYLDNGKAEDCFTQLNQLKTTVPQNKFMVYVVLLQYYTGIPYQTIRTGLRLDYKTESVDQKVKDNISTYSSKIVDFEIKKDIIEKIVSNDFVIKIHRSLVEMIEDVDSSQF